jgi:hypothetical protein
MRITKHQGMLKIDFGHLVESLDAALKWACIFVKSMEAKYESGHI